MPILAKTERTGYVQDRLPRTGLVISPVQKKILIHAGTGQGKRKRRMARKS